MNKTTKLCGAAIVVAILMALGTNDSSVAAVKQAAQKKTPQPEFPFDKVGTVSKHGVDACMQGHILYDLNSVDRKTKDWLSTSSKSDEDVLQKAVKNGGWVRVKGNMMVGVEANCKWVQVSSVTLVKKR
jgi:hypothetical protein